MKMTLLTSLACLGICIAGCDKRPAPIVTERRLIQEISGVGSSVMNPQELEDGLFFSVISKSPANTLHWKLVKGSGSTTAGEEVLPGEKFAYYWDKEKKTFWFATVRAISWTNTSLWTLDKMEFKGDGIKATEGFESDSALPPAFRDNIRQIWK